MSSHEETVKLDETEIWSVPGYYSIPAAERRAGPYIEAFQGTFSSALPAKENESLKSALDTASARC